MNSIAYIMLEWEELFDHVCEGEFTNLGGGMFLVDVVLTIVEVAPSCSPVKSLVETLISVHGS